MSVPNTFNLATGSIPLSQLDANFAYYDAAFSISGTTITFAGTMNGNLTGNVSGNAGTVTNGVYLASAQTLTNKTISGSSNTLSNIGNASLTNSAITINGSAISLGGTASVGTVTSVTGTSPVVSSGGATPAISMAAANTTTNGYLTSTDWNTFNNKQPAGTYVNSVSGTTGRTTSTGGATPAIDLASGVVTAGTTGSSTLIPIVTVDTYGRVTSLTTAANPQGTVTSVGGTGTVNGLTLTGTVTSTGNLTLGGTLDLSAPPAIGTTTPSTGAFTTLSASGNVTLGDASTDTLNVGNGGLVKDASGNLGLGVTPSAWSFSGAMQLKNAAIYGSGAQEAGMYANAYYNAGWKYIAGGQATGYVQNNGHQWHVAGTGTAGNAISFTQAMTLDASGNWFLGTTSGSDKANIAGNATLTTSQPAYGLVDSSNSSYKWIVQNISGALRFYDITAAAERARIDSSGNLLVGTTSVTASARTNISFLSSSGSTGMTLTDSQSNNTAKFVNFYNGSGLLGTISNNNNAAVAYNTSSDYRLKHDIAPMTGALAKVASLKPVTYKWNVNDSDGEGFIAHELQAVCPQAVTGEKDAVDADGNPQYQGIDTSFLVATLTAAIQELKATVDAQAARITALEQA